MVLSQRCDYALRALVELSAAHPSGTRLTAKSLASKGGIPLKFLEQILLTLRRAGLITSALGARGGYTLAKPPHQITFGAVMRVVDGSLAPIACVESGGAHACAEQHHCRFRQVMKHLQDAMASVVDHTTLADVTGKNV
jgi:Rrf2 family protein